MYGSKVTVILLYGPTLPIGGVASGRVCACNLNSRLVFINIDCINHNNFLGTRILLHPITINDPKKPAKNTPQSMLIHFFSEYQQFISRVEIYRGKKVKGKF